MEIGKIIKEKLGTIVDVRTPAEFMGKRFDQCAVTGDSTKIE